MEQELSALVLTLSDTSAAWDSRCASLRRLAAFADLAEREDAARDVLTRTLPALAQPLADAVVDLRSTVVRDACGAIAALSHALGAAFGAAAAHALAPALLAAAKVTIRVIAASAASAGRALFTDCARGVPPRTASALAVAVCASGDRTHVATKAAAAEYIGLLVAAGALRDMPDRVVSEIENAIVSGCADPAQIVRDMSRGNWRVLFAADPVRAGGLLERLSPQAQALVLDEADGDSSVTVLPREGRQRPASHRQSVQLGAPPLRRAPQRASIALGGLSGSLLDLEEDSPPNFRRPLVGTRRAQRQAFGDNLSPRDAAPAAPIPPPAPRQSRFAKRPPRRSMAVGLSGPLLLPRPSACVSATPSAAPVTLPHGPVGAHAGRRTGRTEMSTGTRGRDTQDGSSAVPLDCTGTGDGGSCESAEAESPAVESPSAGHAVKQESDNDPAPLPSSVEVSGENVGGSMGSLIAKSPELMLESSSDTTSVTPKSVAALTPDAVFDARGSLTPGSASGSSESDPHLLSPSYCEKTPVARHRSLSRSSPTRTPTLRTPTSISPVRDGLGVALDPSPSSSSGSSVRGSLFPPTPEAVRQAARKARISFLVGPNVSPAPFAKPDSMERLPSIAMMLAEREHRRLSQSGGATSDTDSDSQSDAEFSPSVGVGAKDEPVDHAPATLKSSGTVNSEADRLAVDALLGIRDGDSTRCLTGALEDSSDSGAIDQRNHMAISKSTEDYAVPSKQLLPDTTLPVEPEHSVCSSASLAGRESNSLAVTEESAHQNENHDSNGVPVSPSGVDDSDAEAKPAPSEVKSSTMEGDMAGTAQAVADIKYAPGGVSTRSRSDDGGSPPPVVTLPSRPPAGSRLRGPRRSIMPIPGHHGQSGTTSIATSAAVRRAPASGPLRPADPSRRPLPRADSVSAVGRRPPSQPSRAGGVSRRPVSQTTLPGGPPRQPPSQTSSRPPVVSRNGPGGRAVPQKSSSSLVGGAGRAGMPPRNAKAAGGVSRPPGRPGAAGAPVSASKRFGDSLRAVEASRGKDWETRVLALTRFQETCQGISKGPVEARIVARAVAVLSDCTAEPHHKVSLAGLDAFFYLLLNVDAPKDGATPATHPVQAALERKPDVLQRILTRLVDGREPTRLAAERVMNSLFAQFRPEVRVMLIVRAIGTAAGPSRGGAGSSANPKVSVAGCKHLLAAFRSAQDSGEGFVWQPVSLLSSLLEAMALLLKDKRESVRGGAAPVVLAANLSLPDGAMELALDALLSKPDCVVIRRVMASEHK